VHELDAETRELRRRELRERALRADARWRDRTDPVNSIISGAPPGELAPSSSGYAANLGISLPGTGEPSLLAVDPSVPSGTKVK